MQKATLRTKGDNKLTYARHYSSLSDVIANDKGTQIRMDSYPSWTEIGRYFSSVKEVHEAMHKVDPVVKEAFDEMAESITKIMPDPKSIKRRAEWDEDDGDDLDIDRLQAGDAPWRKMKRRSMNSIKTITIVFSLGGLSFVAPRDLMWSPVTAIVLADLLENAGYSVKLVARSCAEGAYRGGASSLSTFTVKECDQPVDMTAMQNIASSWFFRLTVMGERHHGPQQVTSGYGRTVFSVLNRYEPDEIDIDYTTQTALFEFPAVHDRSNALGYAQAVLKSIEKAQS